MMKRLVLLLFYFFCTLASWGQPFSVSVFVKDNKGKPLDSYTRVLFYGNQGLAWTTNIRDGGLCTLPIHSWDIDTLLTNQGSLYISTWQATVISGEGFQIHSERFQVNIPSDLQSPVYLTVDTATQSLHGRISNSTSYLPDSVSVRIAPSNYSGLLQTKTDAFGHFKFEGLPMGAYPLEISFDGIRIAEGQKRIVFLPYLQPLEVQLQVFPSRKKYSLLPLTPLTTFKYRPSRSIFIGETVSFAAAALSLWRIDRNRKHFFHASTQQDATMYNTRGNFFKTTLAVSAGSFLSFYSVKLLNRKKHKP